MLKFLSVLVLFSALQAHANDSGLVLVDVLGIAPASGVTRTEVKLYGKDTKRLAQVLPVTDVVGGRSVHFVSEHWVSYIYCSKSYERPTNGEMRNDWMCTLGIEPRAGSVVDNPDIDKAIAEAGMFNTFSGSHNRKALGIVPADTYGLLFSIYGARMNLVAERLPDTLTFSSNAYKIRLSCDEAYYRPTNGELRNDWMCNVFAERR